MARSPRSRRWLRAGAVVGVLFVAYTAFGFLGAPPILRRVLVRRAGEALHREVSVQRVRVNPLVLSVTVEGLDVRERDGSPFVGWESLYVRLAPLRLFAGDLGLAEIRLVRPSVRAGLLADGSLSFQDLLAPSAAPAPPAPTAAPKEEGGLGLSIGRLSIEEARVTFHDATRRPAFESVIGPFTIRLDAFRTRGGGDSPYTFTGTTDAGETFRWTGRVGTQPLRSEGTFAFEKIALPRYQPYLRDATPAEVREGRLDLETRYELEWGPGRHVARLVDGKLAVSDLAVAPPGAADAPLRLPRLEVSGVEVDAVAREAKVAEVALRALAVRVRREADGALELARLAPASAAPAPAPRAGPAQPAWRWSVGAFAITGATIAWEDLATPNPVRLSLTDLSLRLEQLRPGADAAWPFALSFAWPGGGKVAIHGPLRPFASQATLDLDAADLDLVPLQPYLEPGFAARLAAGRLSVRAKTNADASGAAPRWGFAGDVRLDGLSLAERGNPDLLRWRSLEVNGIDAGSEPPRALVRQVRLVEPRAKVYVWDDGTTSVARAQGAPGPASGVRAEGAAGPATPAPAPTPAAAARRQAAPAFRTAIGALEVVNARATFLDRSVTPPAIVSLTRANAKVTQLSSDPRVRSAVDVRLEVEGASPIRISGTLNPLQHGVYTDLVVASEGVDLTPLGPYSGKYLGYGLQKGKLDLDLRYRIEDRRLAATNVVRLNQLTLGDETHSPDAVHVPIRLALALLRDGDGVILLDVPIEGSLDDPDFRFGKVIWHAVLNLLTKMVTSPFRVLAALAGGGDQELSAVEFTVGTSELAPTSQERIAALARSLAKRPALGLEVEGTADEAGDGAALRRAALERSLRRAKAATMKKPPATEEEVAQLVLEPEERARLVKAAYVAAFPTVGGAGAAEKGAGAEKGEVGGKAGAGGKAEGKAGAGGKAEGEAGEVGGRGELTVGEMEERLCAALSIDPESFAALADERAQHARDALIGAGIDQSRLFLTKGGARAAKERGARVYFEVK